MSILCTFGKHDWDIVNCAWNSHDHYIEDQSFRSIRFDGNYQDRICNRCNKIDLNVDDAIARLIKEKKDKKRKREQNKEKIKNFKAMKARIDSI